MPELPEVETIKRGLKKKIIGKSIEKVEVRDSRVIRNSSRRDFVAGIIGSRIRRITRRGKAIIFELGPAPKFLVVQPMMTGQLIYSADPAKNRATKITFYLSNGYYLHYNDQRLFGRLQLVNDLGKIKYLQILGPEPLSRDFSIPWLKEALGKKKKSIKTLLMDHGFLAGIGNIYASEILFASRIKPSRCADSLKEKEVMLLHAATVRVLRDAVRLRGTSMHTYRDASGQKGNYLDCLKVYGRDQEKCLRCHELIKRIVLSGRSTFYCAKCQK